MDNPFDRFALSDLTGRRTLKWQAFPSDVLPLWVAEMDTDLPEPVRAAVTAAIERSEVGYPWGRSYPDALAAFAAASWDWAVDPATLRHTTDVMTGMANVIRLVARPEAVLVITTPVYPPFLDLPAVTGRPVRYARLTVDGRLDPDSLTRELASIRADRGQPVLLLANPHNPTGVAHTRTELEQVAGLAHEYGARVVVDEIHGPLALAGAVFTPYLSVPGTEQAYAVHSASKAFNLPGLKAALIVPGAAAVDEITAGLPESVDHSASWMGVLAHSVALAEGRDWLACHLAGLAANRTLLASLLAERLPGVRWRPPEATYLAWLDCRGLGVTGDPAEVFLTRGRLALNSGTAFGPGGGGHVRLNFATATTILIEAVERIRTSVAD
ncbi:MAG TPA: aminotransferase class I/II-fold pyridoxal phosphate-dependent enzyme [Microlunatus sp.]|nr:aminotransferase class I/II-fold pyridoxal phosphate-dependent enzyme [Microlunatus sp.]